MADNAAPGPEELDPRAREILGRTSYRMRATAITLLVAGGLSAGLCGGILGEGVLVMGETTPISGNRIIFERHIVTAPPLVALVGIPVFAILALVGLVAIIRPVARLYKPVWEAAMAAGMIWFLMTMVFVATVMSVGASPMHAASLVVIGVVALAMGQWAKKGDEGLEWAVAHKKEATPGAPVLLNMKELVPVWEGGVCPHCKAALEPERYFKAAAHKLYFVLLLILYIVPGVLFHRAKRGRVVCPRCRGVSQLGVGG